MGSFGRFRVLVAEFSPWFPWGQAIAIGKVSPPKKKASPKGCLFKIEILNSLAATAAELVLELLNASSRIDEALFTSEDWVGVGSDVANDHLVLDAVDLFAAVCFDCRAGYEPIAG